MFRTTAKARFAGWHHSPFTQDVGGGGVWAGSGRGLGGWSGRVWGQGQAGGAEDYFKGKAVSPGPVGMEGSETGFRRVFSCLFPCPSKNCEKDRKCRKLRKISKINENVQTQHFLEQARLQPGSRAASPKPQDRPESRRIAENRGESRGIAGGPA